MKKNPLSKSILLFFLLATSISCSTAEKSKKETKLEEVCRQAFELATKNENTKPNINDYMENYDLLIRDYPDFEKIIGRRTFEGDGIDGIFGKIAVVGLIGGMAKAYAVYGLNMSDEEIEKVFGENAK